MSYSVDVNNILLYASDRTSPQHTSAIEFLQHRADDSEVFYLAWPVLMSYLRITTPPHIFREPTLNGAFQSTPERDHEVSF